MILIAAALPVSSADPGTAFPEIAVRVDRLRLAKRLWRGYAEDGTEFGFELAAPLREGDVIHQTATARYVIRQEPEAVLAIDLNLAPSAAAGIGWAVGNLHLELMAEPGRLLTPDEKAARQLFERLKVPFGETVAVFRPGRFARGGAIPSDAAAAVASGAQELGSSHKH